MKYHHDRLPRYVFKIWKPKLLKHISVITFCALWTLEATVTTIHTCSVYMIALYWMQTISTFFSAVFTIHVSVTCFILTMKFFLRNVINFFSPITIFFTPNTLRKESFFFVWLTNYISCNTFVSSDCNTALTFLFSLVIKLI